MHLAVWNTPSVDFMLAGLASGALSRPLTVERQDAQTCTDLLLKGFVDAALVPSLTALCHPDVLDVLPGAALSTWQDPYTRLLLGRGLEKIDSVAFDARHVQEALVARIVLKEHYGKEPAFVSVGQPSPAERLPGDRDACLLVGGEVQRAQPGGLVLDLGREWYELVNYPMVWGVFAARKDEATPAMVATLLEMVEAAEQQRPVWIQAREMLPEIHAFYSEGVRLYFDDLATAGLTEFAQYLYFYHITEEIPELPLFLLPDDEADEDERMPLL